MRLTIIITILIAVWRLFITPRLDIPTHTGFHEATAHVWVGMLIGGWIAVVLMEERLRSIRDINWWFDTHGPRITGILLSCGISITAFEIVAFAVQKLHSLP